MDTLKNPENCFCLYGNIVLGKGSNFSPCHLEYLKFEPVPVFIALSASQESIS